jgi:hypothetical protein
MLESPKVFCSNVFIGFFQKAGLIHPKKGVGKVRINTKCALYVFVDID